MTKRVSAKLALPFILLLAACFLMAPVSAMARAVPVTTTTEVTGMVTFPSTPLVTATPTTVTTEAAGTVTPSLNGTTVTTLPTTVPSPLFTAGAESPAPGTPALFPSAAETTAKSPVSLSTVLAGIGVAGIVVVLAKRH